MGRPKKIKDDVEERPPIVNDDAVTEPTEDQSKKKFEPYVPTGDTAKGPKTRASFALDQDGRPDFSSMREGTKAQFKQWMNDPTFRAQIGLGEAQVLPPVFTEEDIKNFFLMFGPIEGYVVALGMRVPPALAVKIFTYTESDLAVVVPPALAIANKYQEYLQWYGAAKEEINFFMAMFTVTSAKLSVLKVERARMKKEAENSNPNPATAPMTTPDDAVRVDGGIRISEVPTLAEVGQAAAIAEDFARVSC